MSRLITNIRNTGCLHIKDSDTRYPSLACLVQECSGIKDNINFYMTELHGYRPVSSHLARSEKKKHKLKFSEDESSYERMEMVKLWFSRMYSLIFSDLF